MNAIPQEIAVVDKPQRQLLMVSDPVPMLDTARFEHMQRVATVMADCSLIPATLQGNDFRQTMANCFMVVNFAVQARMDPFAVAQCASVIHGKLCFEGKLIAAMIAAKLGVDLEYEWNDKQGDAYGIKVFMDVNGKRKDITGTVGDWKTKDKSGNINGQWVGNKAKMQLAYRGAREWCRLHKPGIILGVYSDDEMLAAADMRDVTPISRPVPPKPPVPPSASAETINQTTGEITVDAVAEGIDGDTADVIDDGMVDDTTYFEQLEAALAVVSDLASVEEVFTEFDPMARFEGKVNGEINQGIAMAIRKNAEKRIGSAK